MSEKKLFVRLRKEVNWTKWGLVLTFLMLILSFTGLNLENISSYVSQKMFPKADYVIESWATPTTSIYYNISESLSVSPEYFVVTRVKLKSEIPYLGKPLQFSLSFENKGKKPVERPRIEVYFVDSMYRVWNIWNKSDADDVLRRGCSIEYHFPPLDSKVLGMWSIFVLTYDDAEGALVSYALRFFQATDVATSWWETLILLNFLIISIPVSFIIYTLYRSITAKAKEKRARK